MLTSSGGSLNADRGEGGGKILLTSYVNAPLAMYYGAACYLATYYKVFCC